MPLIIAYKRGICKELCLAHNVELTNLFSINLFYIIIVKKKYSVILI